jgi:hypothetical protein
VTGDEVPAELLAMLTGYDLSPDAVHLAKADLAAILTRFAQMILHGATTIPGPWLDDDELLNAISALSRIPSAEQPGDWAALATKVNQLIDNLGMGAPLPTRLATAQRVGPYARPIIQRLELVFSESGPEWTCLDCRAVLQTVQGEPREEEGFVLFDITGTIEHRAPCTEVRE